MRAFDLFYEHFAYYLLGSGQSANEAMESKIMIFDSACRYHFVFFYPYHLFMPDTVTTGIVVDVVAIHLHCRRLFSVRDGRTAHA
jgi:hypothetical protein